MFHSIMKLWAFICGFQNLWPSWPVFIAAKLPLESFQRLHNSCAPVAKSWSVCGQSFLLQNQRYSLHLCYKLTCWQWWLSFGWMLTIENTPPYRDREAKCSVEEVFFIQHCTAEIIGFRYITLLNVLTSYSFNETQKIQSALCNSSPNYQSCNFCMASPPSRTNNAWPHYFFYLHLQNTLACSTAAWYAPWQVNYCSAQLLSSIEPDASEPV
jgi:hypothetical protein